MKKKILAMCLIVCLLAVAVVGGTLAYFTDTDAAKNIMTVGNVSIVQHEKDSSGKNFEDGQKMYPITPEGNNWIDKIVTVENDGSEDAYVRTLIAFKMLEEKDANGNVIGYIDPIDAFGGKALDTRTSEGLCFKWNPAANGDSLYWPLNSNDGVNLSGLYKSGNDYTYVQLNGHVYAVAVYYYYGTMEDYNSRGTATKCDSVLGPGEISHPSLVKVGLEGAVTNEQAAYFTDYEILVVSQAVQTAGFETDTNGNGSVCDEALNEAFGAVETVDQATLNTWFANAK